MKGPAAACTLGLAALSACDASQGALITASMIEGDAIPAPLAADPGDAERGRTIFTERERGHCVICHTLGSVDAPFQGNLGPTLTGIGARLTPGQIRLRIAKPSEVWPETVMPSYYRVGGLHQVRAEFAGAPILSAQEIEDLVAFLSLQHAEDEFDVYE